MESELYQPGIWTEFGSFVPDSTEINMNPNSMVTSIEYDKYFDILWVATANGNPKSKRFQKGRVTSYGFSSNEEYIDGTISSVIPTMYRYSSFTTPTLDIIQQILPNNNSIISIAQSVIEISTYGGALIGSITVPIAQNIDSLESKDIEFTCGDLLYEPLVSRSSSSFTSTHILAGTSDSAMHVFDIVHSLESIVNYDVKSPSMKVQSNGYLTSVASQDGCIRFLDGKFRSIEVINTIEAHSGVIKDMCMKSDGRTLITCGTIRKPINPYDRNSPYHYTSDLQIKAIDVRMQRELLPLPIIIPSSRGASFLRFIPQVITENSILEYTGVVMCTDDGIIQVNTLTNESLELVSSVDVDTQQSLFAPLSIANEAVKTIAVSASGQYMAVGTSIGTVGQYIRASDSFLYDLQHRTNETKATELFKVNERSPFPKLSPHQKPVSPLLSLSVDSSIVGTAYVLNMPLTAPSLSSSFQTTPSLFNRKLKFSSSRKINPDLLSKVSRQEFIGIVPNTGNYKPNSMISVASRASSLKGGIDAVKASPYAICDPRRLELLESKNTLNESINNSSIASEIKSVPNNVDYDTEVLRLYSKPNSYSASKQRFKKFDYSLLNVTRLVGLENNVPNSFLNPLLQLLYWIPSFRAHALLSQLHPYHYEQQPGPGGIGSSGIQSTLLCEMGFLFHMISSVEKCFDSNPSVDKVVRAANFQRIFQSVQLDPEAAVLGIFDEIARQDLQQFIQVFNPFLLRLLSKEIEKELKCHDLEGESTNHTSSSIPGAKGFKLKYNIDSNVRAAINSNTVDNLFGFTTKSSTTFLHSGVHKVDPDCSKYLVLDLIYPTLSINPAVNTANSINSLSPNISQVSPDLSDKISNSSKSHQMRGIAIGKKCRKNVSFATSLWNSFRKEITMKGWCKESEAFEPFKKVQTIISLPKVLLVQCGNTQIDIKDSTTLGGAIGEIQGHGSLHANFWNHPIEIRNSTKEDDLILETNNQMSYRWLPIEIEIAYAKANNCNLNDISPQTNNKNYLEIKSRLIISCKCVSLPSNHNVTSNSSSTEKDDMKNELQEVPETVDQSAINNSVPIWIIYDGISEFISEQPASLCTDCCEDEDWQVSNFHLKAVVAQVHFPFNSSSDEMNQKHLVLHINKGERERGERESNSDEINTEDGWYLLNDFIAQKINIQEVLSFPSWKHPVIVAFEQNDNLVPTTSFVKENEFALIIHKFDPKINKQLEIPLVVPDSVLQLESLSHTPSIRLLQSFAHVPGPGDLIAFDGEFVSVSLEKSSINSSGERMVNEETRQVLARISLLDIGKSSKQFDDMQLSLDANSLLAGNGVSGFNKQMMRIVADDYILPVEPVVDYVTRFSGITADDLDPSTSRHSVISQRSAYLKLRYFIDRKCIFVGHGLQKDFETANIFVPPNQIRDTVELWRLPNQRKISLRFLASYILKEDIQDEIHDSIEDAKTALLLYHHYKALEALGIDKVTEVLLKLYQYGNKNNWTIGMDRFK